MLNWAARYFPIARMLKRYLNSTDAVLEIASGSDGLKRESNQRHSNSSLLAVGP
jgi:hypothetical protein